MLKAQENLKAITKISLRFLASIHKVSKISDLSCAIAAPTGLAAFNVGGMTIHRLFHLPIEHEGRQAGYWSLSKPSQKVMKSTLRSLKLVIVDEVSMVSSLNLAYMHLRLEELFGLSRIVRNLIQKSTV